MARKATTAAIIATLLGSITLAASPAAVAASSPPTTAESGKTVTAGLVYGGIDDAQAKRAGNIVKYDGNEKVLVDGKTGKEILRIARDPKVARDNAVRESQKTVASGEASTQGTGGRQTVRGNCGSTTLGLNTAGSRNHSFTMGTSFTTNIPSWNFVWEVDYTLNRRYFDRFYDDGPITPRRTWTSSLVLEQAPGKGYLVINMPPGVDQAYLIDGGVCFAAPLLETADVP